MTDGLTRDWRPISVHQLSFFANTGSFVAKGQVEDYGYHIYLPLPDYTA